MHLNPIFDSLNYTMFGRLRGYFKKNDSESLDLYHQTYCGACYALDNRFGAKGRLILSYEIVAAFALILTLSDSEFQTTANTCPLKGFGKRDRFLFDSTQINNLLDLYLFIIWLKASDDITDEKGLKRILASIFKSALDKEIVKIESKLSDNGFPVDRAKDIVLSRNATPVRWLDESLNQSSELIGLFGDYLADIAGFTEQKSDLMNLGRNLGRCIDLIDMIEDLSGDIRARRFNPLVEIYGKDSGNPKILFDNAKPDLIYLASELSCDLAISLDKLSLKRHDELIRGIFGRSVESRFSKLLFPDRKCTCQSEEVYA